MVSLSAGFVHHLYHAASFTLYLPREDNVPLHVRSYLCTLIDQTAKKSGFLRIFRFSLLVLRGAQKNQHMLRPDAYCARQWFGDTKK